MKKIDALKNLDRLVGSVLCSILGVWPVGRGAAGNVASVLVIRPGGIGDAVLLIPALAALRKAFPGVAIDVLCEERNAAVFEMASGIRKVHRYDTAAGLCAALSGRYDVVVDTEQWYRLSAVVARLCRASMRIGFGTNGRRRLFTHPVTYRHDLYEAESFLSLLGPLGVKGECSVPFLEIPATALAAAEALLHPVRGRRFVCLFPGASVEEKRWGSANFRAVADGVRARGVAVVVIGGAGETPAAEEILAGRDGLNLAGKGGLAVTAAVLARCEALVTGDSGVLHLACGLGIPTVSLFGPSSAAKWGPSAPGHAVVASGASCAPCSRFGTIPPCASPTCLKEIAVESVLAPLERILAVDAVRASAPGEAPDGGGRVAREGDEAPRRPTC